MIPFLFLLSIEEIQLTSWVYKILSRVIAGFFGIPWGTYSPKFNGLLLPECSWMHLDGFGESCQTCCNSDCNMRSVYVTYIHICMYVYGLYKCVDQKNIHIHRYHQTWIPKQWSPIQIWLHWHATCRITPMMPMIVFHIIYPIPTIWQGVEGFGIYDLGQLSTCWQIDKWSLTHIIFLILVWIIDVHHYHVRLVRWWS